jgi:hypothetical protein
LELPAAVAVGCDLAAQAAGLHALCGHHDVGEQQGSLADQGQAKGQLLAGSEAARRAAGARYRARALRAAGLAILAHGSNQGGHWADLEQRAVGAGRGGLIGAEALPQPADQRATDGRPSLVVQLQRRDGGGGELQVVGGQVHRSILS